MQNTRCFAFPSQVSETAPPNVSSQWGPRGDPTKWSSWGEEAQWRERALPLAAKRAIRNLCRRRGARRLGAPSVGAICGRPSGKSPTGAEIAIHCRAGACPRRYLPGYPPGGHAAFLKVASLDFYRKRPRRLRRGGRPHFFPKKWGERRAGGLSAFSKRMLRIDLHRRRPRRLRPRPPKRGPMAAVGCTHRAETGRALPPASSAQVADRSLRRKRQSSFPPLCLLSPPNPLRWASAGAP